MNEAVLLLATWVQVANPVHAEVDRSKASTEDQILLTVIVENQQAQEPEIPRIPGARVERRGRFRATQIINGTRSDTMSFKFAVFPRREGPLRIPPIPVRVGTRVYKTNPIQVEIDAGNPDELKPFFALAAISEQRPYRSQQIVYTLQLYAELLKLSCKKIELPNFDKFIVEDLGQERRFQTVRNGRRFSVLELRRSLFPLEAGVVTIPAAEFTCTVTYPSTRGLFPNTPLDQFMSRGRTETKLLKSEAITIDVRALPPAPPDFSNIVGSVQVSSRFNEQRLIAGNSVTQSIYIRSEGNLRGFRPPPPQLENVKVYDDRETIVVNDRGNVSETEFRMNRALVPVEPGEIEVPGFTVSYFDPVAERYQRATSESFTLSVAPNPNAESLGLVDATGLNPRNEVSVAETTLMPAAVSPLLGVRPLPVWLVFLAALLPPLLLLLSIVARSSRTRRAQRAPLRRVIAPLAEGSIDDADLVERIVREVLHRGDESLRAATASEVESGLAGRGVSNEDGARAAAWLRWAEASRYGGNRVTPPESRKELESLLSRLDRQLGDQRV